jgi:hypothetical protein
MNTGLSTKTMKGLLMTVCVGFLLLSACGTPTPPPKPTPYGAITPAEPFRTVEAPQLKPSPTFVYAPEQHLLNPYQNFRYWYKGQVHVHSDKSADAPSYGVQTGRGECAFDNSPREVEKVYEENGYDFIALTDHDTITRDPGVEGILHIDSEESASSGELPLNYFPPHILGIDIEDDSDHDWSCQARIDEYSWRQNGLAVLAHPDDPKREYNEERCVGPNGIFLQDLYGYTGVQTSGKDNFYEVVRQWDEVLRTRRRVWLFAADDSHCAHDSSQINQGWIVVNSDQEPIYKDDIVQNLRTGNFYSVIRVSDQLGDLQLDSVKVMGNRVQISGGGASRIHFLDNAGQLPGPLAMVKQNPNEDFFASYPLDDSWQYPSPHIYLRILIIDRYGNIAFLQPLFVKSLNPPSGVKVTSWQASGWNQPWTEVKGVGNEGQGAGMAIANLDNDLFPEMVLMALDPNEPRFRYQIGWDVGMDGKADQWTGDWKAMRGLPFNGDAEGANVALTKLDEDPRPELVFMAYFRNKFRYWIGWNVQSNGEPERWEEPLGPNGEEGVGLHADGAGVAFRDLNGNGRPEMALMAYDPNQPRFRYKIGWDMQNDGRPAYWTGGDTTGFVGKAQGAGIAFAFLDDDSRPEMVMMAYVTYAERAGPNSFLYKIGWNVQENGEPTAWSTGMDSVGCCGNEGQGAGIVFDDLNRNGRLDLIFMAYDAPIDKPENNFRYMIGWDVTMVP